MILSVLKFKSENIPLLFPLLTVVPLIFLFAIDNTESVYIIFFIGFLRLLYDKFSVEKPATAFILPWLILFTFLNLPITQYSRSVNPLTLKLISIPVFTSLIFTPELFTRKLPLRDMELLFVKKFTYNVLWIVCLLLFFANVAYSGYLPLLRTMQGLDSDYMNYGIKGVNGLFYAFSNAFALVSYYLFRETRQKKYLYNILIIIAIFLLCLTRQNVISLLVEIFIFHVIKYQRIPFRKILPYFIAFILGFSFLGELRSGDIRGIMGLKKEFYWLPSSFIWIYSYFFFNVLNLDNLVKSGKYELLDGSSVATLLPSFLRPKFEDAENLLEVINFNISSYINPVFRDWGFNGIILFSVIIVFITMYLYNKAIKRKSFALISCYSVMLFCALFSFFVNFWFYLPIIFQIPFLIFFDKKILAYAK